MYHDVNGHLHRDLTEGPAVYMTEEREGVMVKCNPFYYANGELYTIMLSKDANRMIDGFQRLTSLPVAAPIAPFPDTLPVLLLPSIPAVTDLPAPIIPDSIPSLPSLPSSFSL